MKEVCFSVCLFKKEIYYFYFLALTLAIFSEWNSYYGKCSCHLVKRKGREIPKMSNSFSVCFLGQYWRNLKHVSLTAWLLWSLITVIWELFVNSWMPRNLDEKQISMCDGYVVFFPGVYRLGGMCIHHERSDLPSTDKVPDFQRTLKRHCRFLSSYGSLEILEGIYCIKHASNKATH